MNWLFVCGSAHASWPLQKVNARVTLIERVLNCFLSADEAATVAAACALGGRTIGAYYDRLENEGGSLAPFRAQGFSIRTPE